MFQFHANFTDGKTAIAQKRSPEGHKHVFKRSKKKLNGNLIVAKQSWKQVYLNF